MNYYDEIDDGDHIRHIITKEEGIVINADPFFELGEKVWVKFWDLAKKKWHKEKIHPNELEWA